MNQFARNKTIERMRRGTIRLLIATDVAARGLDVNGISHVINFDLPRFAEDYVHRIGRTGRAGASGIAISFVSSSELSYLERIERFIGKKLPEQNIEGLAPLSILRRVAGGGAAGKRKSPAGGNYGKTGVKGKSAAGQGKSWGTPRNSASGRPNKGQPRQPVVEYRSRRSERQTNCTP